MTAILGQNQPITMKVNLNDMPEFECAKCMGKVFISAVRLKRVSKIQSGMHSDSVAPIPTFVCMGCGTELQIEIS